jgi:PST family polysaccharide transporter
MSRLLTKDDFGYYAAITAITTVFASFSETGIGAALVQKKEITREYINNAFSLSLLFGLFISGLLLLLAKPLSAITIDHALVTPLMLMSITLLCNCLTSVNISIMQRNLQFLRIGLVHLVSLIVTTSIAIILAIKGFGFYAILVKAILGSILTLVISFFCCGVKFRFRLEINTIRSIFNFSGWLMASVFFRNFAQQADRLLMGRLLSVTSLGAYNRPKEFINQISSKLNGIFDTALFPILSGIQDNKASMAKAYKTSLYYMNIFSIVLMMGFIFNSELIIRIFLGESWLDIKSVFIVLSVSLLFNIDGRLVDCYFRSLGLTKQQFFFRILELVIQVIALIIGSYWDIFGVAISVVFASAVMIVVKLIYLSSWINLSTIETITTIIRAWKCALFIIPFMTVSVILFPHSWIWNSISFALFCLLLILCFLIFPNSVGKMYKNNAYLGVMNYLQKKVFRNKGGVS